MAQTITLSHTVEDILDVAEVLNDLRDLIPEEYTALDFLTGQLLGIAEQLETQEERP